MIKLIGDKLPQKVFLALSGGPDSMAILDFLLRGGREVIALYFNHGTEHGDYAEEFVTEYCKSHNVMLIVERKNRARKRGESPEEYWRNMRYNFFNKYDDHLLIMGHNLDDQVEQWVFTSLHGNPRLIPYRRGNVIRPFMLTSKAGLLDWCERKNVPYVVDPSNSSEKYMRSYIRSEIIPKALRVNPGLYKVIKKKILNGETGHGKENIK